jgi:hypothetical protein
MTKHYLKDLQLTRTNLALFHLWFLLDDISPICWGNWSKPSWFKGWLWKKKLISNVWILVFFYWFKKITSPPKPTCMKHLDLILYV